ncbi:TerB N-terminal domain-containing protein [Snodgrassella sp. ESL0253]|uniref:tellurite resistance TerB family protein n=1 Tax=Snodgrassella sp. ESL0253 TaxID=2705031 RepID=UPI0015828DEC|nr:TerB N-terminal domain-containing protein [Snodgrassella sp. ESL0253]NUE67503.1 ATPase [Snodgrassella sp. ESL0253]
MAFFTCIVIIGILMVIFSSKKNHIQPAPKPRNRTNKNKATATLHNAGNKPENPANNSLPQQSSAQANVSTVIAELMAQDNENKQSADTAVDDELATFTITSGSRTKISGSENTEEGRWLAPDTSITIHNRKLARGFIFYGNRLKGLNGYSLEDCLIDPALPAFRPMGIENYTEFYTDASLCYWPSYTGLSQQCRGVYLDWLASDRSHQNMPIGYVFLYFYGLERRIIANKDAIHSIEVKEYLEIFHEIVRLRQIYGSNNSFNNYSGNLLALMIYLRPSITKHLKNELFQFSNELFFKLILAVTVKNEKPIKASLALDWLRYSPEYYFRSAARRCKEEFQQLFFLKFKEYFADGMLIKPNKTRLKIDYQAANRSAGYYQWDNTNLPDPSILKTPLKNLIAIAEQCTDQLGDYSRYLARENSSRDDFDALMLLPVELLNANNSPVISQFRQWVNHVLLEQNGLASVRDFWKNIRTDLPKAINKKENALMQRVVSKFGLAMVPDSRIQQIKINPDGFVVLYQLQNIANLLPSQEFRSIELLLRLGVLVANIDGFIHDKEKELLRYFIDSNKYLQDAEKQYLHAFLIWCLNNTYGMQGLKDKIEKLDSSQKKIISNLLIYIALADGVVETREIKQIEKLYTALGLDKSTVASDIHTLSVSTAQSVQTQPVTISEHTKTAADKPENLILDAAVLKLHESQTSDVQSLLGAIFADNEKEEQQPPQTEIHDSQKLDNTHQQLFDILITQEHWTHDEYLERCKQLNLLPDGAIETINEWAYACVDAPLIEEDDDIYIDFEILAELQG